MRNILRLIAVTAVLLNGLAAKEPKFERVEAELGDDLGFHIFKVATPLAADELLVIRETSTENGSVSVYDAYVIAQGRDAEYRVVMVDSSAFVPKVRSVMLRYMNQRTFYEDVMPSQQEYGTPHLKLEFTDTKTLQKVRTMEWTAKIEKITDYVQRHPEAAGLQKNVPHGDYFSSAGRHAVKTGQ